MRKSLKRHVVARVRLEARLQQKELAQRIDVATVTIKKIESLARPLTETIARKIGDALGVSPAYLLANKRYRTPVTADGEPWTYETYRHRLLHPPYFLDGLKDVEVSLTLFRNYAWFRRALRSLKDPIAASERVEQLLGRAYKQFLKEYPEAAKARSPDVGLPEILADAEFLRSNLSEDVIEGDLNHDFSGHRL